MNISQRTGIEGAAKFQESRDKPIATIWTNSTVASKCHSLNDPMVGQRVGVTSLLNIMCGLRFRCGVRRHSPHT